MYLKYSELLFDFFLVCFFAFGLMSISTLGFFIYHLKYTNSSAQIMKPLPFTSIKLKVKNHKWLGGLQQSLCMNTCTCKYVYVYSLLKRSRSHLCVAAILMAMFMLVTCLTTNVLAMEAWSLALCLQREQHFTLENGFVTNDLGMEFWIMS